MTSAVPPARCRSCKGDRLHLVIDLGMSPLSNGLRREADLRRSEVFHPLRLLVCERCYLVQVEACERPSQIFDADYVYFSSYSDSWVAHARTFAEAMVERLALGGNSLVVEIASNDGYLLQWFAGAGIPILGIEPAASVATEARRKGIPTDEVFFGAATGADLARRGRRADLLVGNNVLAHVPDIDDFVEGLAHVLAPAGTISLEFPHLLPLLDDALFDTIYHEHYSYLSLAAVEDVLGRHGLVVVDVEPLTTHGGSLRVFARHAQGAPAASAAVHHVRAMEASRGLRTLDAYTAFGARVADMKYRTLEFLIDAARSGKRVVGYGAPAKATTFLNYCGIRPDLIAFTADRSPHKQGRYVPGVHLPITAPEVLDAARPDYIVVFPWNLRDEITAQLHHVREWGGRFVQFVPRLEVF